MCNVVMCPVRQHVMYLHSMLSLGAPRPLAWAIPGIQASTELSVCYKKHQLLYYTNARTPWMLGDCGCCMYDLNKTTKPRRYQHRLAKHTRMHLKINAVCDARYCQTWWQRWHTYILQIIIWQIAGRMGAHIHVCTRQDQKAAIRW